MSIDTIKKKILRYSSQSIVFFAMTNTSLEKLIDITERSSELASYSGSLFGQINYLIELTAVPVIHSTVMGFVTYMAVKGTGMFYDRLTYNKQKVL